MAWLTDKEDLSRAAIFSETDIDAYRFILKSREKNGTDPSLDYFRSFPAASFKLEVRDDDRRAAAAAIEDRKGVQLHVAGSTFIDLHDEGKFDEALALMVAEAERIGRTAGGGSLPFRMIPLAGLDDLPDPEPLIEGTWTAHRHDAGRPVRQGQVLHRAGLVVLGRERHQLAGRGPRAACCTSPPKARTAMKCRVRSWQDAHRKIHDEKHHGLITDPVQFGDPGGLPTC